MTQCPHSPSVLTAQQNAEERERAAALSRVTQQIGDTIHYVREIIVQPTHQERFGRMVRVRYEPVKRYMYGTETIQTIGWTPNGGVYFNDGIWPHNLCGSAEEARQQAESLQRKWDEHVRFSEMCR